MAGKAADKAWIDEPKPAERTFEVVVSFSGLNKGVRFTTVLDAWASHFLASGYLQDVTEAEEVPDAGRGEVGQG